MKIEVIRPEPGREVSMGFVKAGSFVAATLVAAVVLLTWRTAEADPYTFTCYRYVDGKPTGGWINMKAESKSEAESKAYQRFKELGGRVDYAKCKY